MTTDQKSIAGQIANAMQNIGEQIAEPILEAGDGMIARAMGRGYSEIDARRIGARYVTLAMTIVGGSFDQTHKSDE